MKHLALFDFDGTITEKDTLLEIAKFSTNRANFVVKSLFLIPSIVLMKAGIISNQKGKEIFLKKFFKGYSEQAFNQKCAEFGKNEIPKLIRPLALARIEEEQSNGNKVYIVSASPDTWIKPWADKYAIEVISTRLKFENDRLKGIDGINCNGEEKVRRIKEEIDLSDYQKVIAFGDTKGDLPMLALAKESHYKPFQ